MLSNGNSFGNGQAMDLGSGASYGADGSRPPSWWFMFPADPVWRLPA